MVKEYEPIYISLRLMRPIEQCHEIYNPSGGLASFYKACLCKTVQMHRQNTVYTIMYSGFV